MLKRDALAQKLPGTPVTTCVAQKLPGTPVASEVETISEDVVRKTVQSINTDHGRVILMERESNTCGRL